MAACIVVQVKPAVQWTAKTNRRGAQSLLLAVLTRRFLCRPFRDGARPGSACPCCSRFPRQTCRRTALVAVYQCASARHRRSLAASPRARRAGASLSPDPRSLHIERRFASSRSWPSDHSNVPVGTQLAGAIGRLQECNQGDSTDQDCLRGLDNHQVGRAAPHPFPRISDFTAGGVQTHRRSRLRHSRHPSPHLYLPIESSCVKRSRAKMLGSSRCELHCLSSARCPRRRLIR